MPAPRFLAKHRRCLRTDTRAATAVEYGLILALVVLVIILSISAVADATVGMWNSNLDKVSRAR